MYNVIVQDPRRDNLKIREDGTGGVFVEALSEHVVRNTDEVMKLIQDGARLRTTSMTKMNKVCIIKCHYYRIVVVDACISILMPACYRKSKFN